MTNTDFPDDKRIKSRPVYDPPDTLPKAGAYLCLAETGAVDMLAQRLRRLGDAQVDVLVCGDEGARAVAELNLPGVVPRTCPSDGAARELSVRLEDTTLGWHLVVAGSEPFLWDIHGVALEHGLLEGEITLIPEARSHRRVFCAHCRAMTEPVTVSPATCHGCGLTLEVRDHFSRRLGAYLGVRIDAETPGEIPHEEVLN